MDGAFDEDLPFKVVRTTSYAEVVARATNLVLGRAAYESALKLYPQDTVQYKYGATIIAQRDREQVKVRRAA
jgi:hypothetical protein